MPDLRSFRVPWFALLPVLVLPLLGQDCETCPQPANPCQESVMSVSADGNECITRNVDDGKACDSAGNPGVCANGQCVTSQGGECTGDEVFGICDEPVGGGPVGACADDMCILAAPEDHCMKVGVGRINCCTEDGCQSASGAYCTDRLPDGTSCDPTGVEPAGQAGQDGICLSGTCVAQTGTCAGLSCPTSASDPCARDYCDTVTGACSEFVVRSFETCATSAGVDAVCNGGTCKFRGDPGPCDVCDDGNSCTYDFCDVLEDESVVCTHESLKDGDDCLNGEQGQCFRGNCAPILQPCGNDADCDDGNPCTVSECNPFGGLCDTLVSPDGTRCFNDQGLCQSGICVPDLCIGRNCDDGNSCTGDPVTGQDICIPPYGICSSPNLPDGTSCENNGQCLFGNCQPVFSPCSNDADCDDGNSCTVDDCDPFGGICSNTTLPNGSPCIGENGTCILGSCGGFEF